MADMDPEERAYAECAARLDALREEAAKTPTPKAKKTDTPETVGGTDKVDATKE